MKAWQLITHTASSPTYRRLKAGVSDSEKDLYGSFRPTEQVGLAWERTLEIANILDAQIVLFQCPKSFPPTDENLRNFADFFRAIERGGRRLAWEPRGPDWPAELIRELCEEHALIHCVDPFAGEQAYGGTLYWRLHGRGGYRYRYTDQDLDELDGKLAQQSRQPGPHYVMFNNIYSREDASRFAGRTRSS